MIAESVYRQDLQYACAIPAVMSRCRLLFVVTQGLSSLQLASIGGNCYVASVKCVLVVMYICRSLVSSPLPQSESLYVFVHWIEGLFCVPVCIVTISEYNQQDTARV